MKRDDSNDDRPTERRHAAPRRARSAALPGACLVLCLALGCAFGGYVPKGQHKPVAETERHVSNILLGQSAAGDLDCPEGRCRVRYRVVVPAPGELSVRVAGPTGQGSDVGPRIARVVLEGPKERIIDRAHGDDQDVAPDALVVEGAVEPGIHHVLVQALGGRVDFQVTPSFTPEGGAATPVAPATPTWATAAPEGDGDDPSRPGGISDGADFAYDPKAQLRGVRRYAFAQNPQERLEGEPGSVHGNPFVDREIQREIRYYLADRGMIQVPAEEAEILLTLNVGSRSTTWYSVNSSVFNQAYDDYFAQWSGAGLHIRPHTYRDGTLVIDIIDAETNVLVWHGWTTEPIVFSKSDKRIIREAVANVLGQFPPQ